MSWLSKKNVYNQIISEEVGVTIDVAQRIHDYIDEWFDFDWSEATRDEIKLIALAAFENLNDEVIF